MENANYMVEQMIKHQDMWTESVDEYGQIVIINRNGHTVHGVGESDGTITSAETLITMYNDRIKKD